MPPASIQHQHSCRTRKEGRLVWFLLHRLLTRFPRDIQSEARDVALAGYAKAIQTLLQVLVLSSNDEDSTGKAAAHKSISRLERQSRIAETVVSQGGLNDAARTYLRQTSNFAQLVRNEFLSTTTTTTTTEPPIQDASVETQHDAATTITGRRIVKEEEQPSTEKSSSDTNNKSSPSFHPESFRPLIMGSGRLAAAFVAGFQRLGVPNDNMALFSRNPMGISNNDDDDNDDHHHETTTKDATNDIHPFRKWLDVLGEGNPPPRRCFSPDTLLNDEDEHKPDVIFLLIKRKAFDDVDFHKKFQSYWKTCGRPVVVNLMAGSPLPQLDSDNDDEKKNDATVVVVRANVMVSQPNGGNLLCCQHQLQQQQQKQQQQWMGHDEKKNPSLSNIFDILERMGKLLPFSRKELLGKLTFFTSTVPLVLLNELDQALYRRGSDDGSDYDDLAAAADWSERASLAEALAIAATNAQIDSTLLGAEVEAILGVETVDKQLEETLAEYMDIYLGLA